MTQNIANGGSLGLLFVDLGIKLGNIRIGEYVFRESTGYFRTNTIKSFDRWVFESATSSYDKSPNIVYGATKDTTPPLVPIGFDIYFFQRLSRSPNGINLMIGSYPVNGHSSYETVKKEGLHLTEYSTVDEFRQQVCPNIARKWHNRLRYIRERIGWWAYYWGHGHYPPEK
jgi:hypothetical protein